MQDCDEQVHVFGSRRIVRCVVGNVDESAADALLPLPNSTGVDSVNGQPEEFALHGCVACGSLLTFRWTGLDGPIVLFMCCICTSVKKDEWTGQRLGQGTHECFPSDGINPFLQRAWRVPYQKRLGQVYASIGGSDFLLFSDTFARRV